MTPLAALLIIHLITTLVGADTIKITINSRPVHEAHNEHSRTDNRIRTAKAPQLPYGNPFASNNYLLYARNQQAMFNAEKMRQHRAQQRWNHAPMDTYMKAYRESQENHHLALEHQLAIDNIPERVPKQRQEIMSQKVRENRPDRIPKQSQEINNQQMRDNVPERIIGRDNQQRQEIKNQQAKENRPDRIPKQSQEINSQQTRDNRPERINVRENLQRQEIKSQQTRDNRPDWIPKQSQEINNQQTRDIIPERIKIRENLQRQEIKSHLPRENRPEGIRETLRQARRQPKFVVLEPTKITIADAIKDGNRNHRSQGSDHKNYLALKRYQTIYVSPAPTYDQGVTIKPNGIVGLSHNPEPQTKLLTKAIPSTEAPIYPRPYPLQSYDNLNSLLGQPAQDQLSNLNALIQASKGSESTNDIETPIELFFYGKDPPIQTLSSHYESNPTLGYASAYMRDHKPIAEDIDDINPVDENINYTPQTPIVTRPSFHYETTTTKSNNYYKVEVASQTIKSGVKPQDHHEHREVKAPSFQEASYQPVYYHPSPEKPVIEHYSHNMPKGIQHLTPAGTEVSLYDDESENLHYASNYEFGYRVHDYEAGNDFGHQEAKIGDSTNGQYHVLLPDGRMQRVRYSAGPEGFHADVSYDHAHLQHEK